jgi:hypothetical protein
MLVLLKRGTKKYVIKCPLLAPYCIGFYYSSVSTGGQRQNTDHEEDCDGLKNL